MEDKKPNNNNYNNKPNFKKPNNYTNKNNNGVGGFNNNSRYNKNNNSDQRIKSLEDRFKRIEDMLTKLTGEPSGNKSAEKKPDVRKFPTSTTSNKPKPKDVRDEEGFVNNELQAETKKGDIYIIKEEEAVKESICAGDSLIITAKEGEVSVLKVAQRAKRQFVNSIVVQNNQKLYAVNENGNFMLLKNDVQTKRVYKGFEVSVILPQKDTKKVKTALIKEVISKGTYTGGLEGGEEPNLEIAKDHIDKKGDEPTVLPSTSRNEELANGRKFALGEYSSRVIEEGDLR